MIKVLKKLLIPKIAISVLSVLTLSIIILVVGFYCYKFRYLSKDPAVWAQFGDYFGGVLNPLFSLFNIVVVIYIAITIYNLNEEDKRSKEKTEEQIRIVFELHREWNSDYIYKSRTLAGTLVRKFPKDTLLIIESRQPPDEVVHIWIVIGFFLRLSYLVSYKKVDNNMVIELFGELFVWWWIVSFERQLVPCDWDAKDRMVYLKKWFYDNTTEVQRKPWLRRANQDLKIALQRVESQGIDKCFFWRDTK